MLFRSHSGISNCCAGKRNHAGGFIWKYNYITKKGKEIEEIKFRENTYTREKVNKHTDKINELVRAMNKLIEESEVK